MVLKIFTKHNWLEKYGFGGFWGATKKERIGFLKIKFYKRVIMSFYGATRIKQGIIKKTPIYFISFSSINIKYYVENIH